MKKRVLFGIIVVAALFIMTVIIRRRLGVLPIRSAVEDIDTIDVGINVNSGKSGKESYTLTDSSIVSNEISLSTSLFNSVDEYAYIEYKINGFNYGVGYAPSYEAVIDTKGLPDGLNQLLVLGYEKDSKLKGGKQIIFKVENNTKEADRAKRYGKTYGLGLKPSYKNDYIPVLMYHDFKENITKEQESAVVNPKLFEKQIELLLENGYTPINFNDLYLYMEEKAGLPPKPIIITADDGYLSNYEVAFPILKKYNVPATFFVTTRYVGVETSSPHFTWEQAREMEESGLIDIQSHTHGHLLLNTLPDDEMRHQVDVSFGIIEENLGKRDVKVLAYPQFYHNSHTKRNLTEVGVDLQITRLAKKYNPTTKATNIQRIHVANYTSPEELLGQIRTLTQL